MDWMHAELPTSDAAGYGGGYLPLSSLLTPEERPVGFREGRATVVYIVSEVDPDKVSTFEQDAFDDRVGISSRLFNCIRMCAEDIRSEEVKKELKVDRGPVIFLFGSDGKLIKTLGGWTLKGNTLYNTLSVTAKAEHRFNLATFLRKENDLLKKIDEVYWKIEDGKFDLTELRQRTGKSAERQIEKLEAELAELQKEHDALVAEEDAYVTGILSGSVASDN